MLSVAVANLPIAFLTLAAELSAAGLPFLPPPELEPELPDVAALSDLLLREPTTPPTTAAIITAMRIGIPNLTHGLTPGFFFSGIFPKAD
jgi:hypothetical protein